MDIWDWAQAAYARPGVQAACLELQDRHGQSTCLLLWAVWAEANEPTLLQKAAAIAAAWEEVAVAPLRQLRRSLRTHHAGLPDDEREALRREVQACELSAERRLLETLARLTPDLGGAASLEALDGASRAWKTPAPRDALAALAAALG